MTDRMHGQKLIALCLVLALTNLYSIRTFGSTARSVMLGDLTTVGQVSVNGTQAISGISVSTDSEIATTPDSTASLRIGKLGQVVLLERSDARIGFSDSTVTGELGRGELHASVPAGVAARVIAGACFVASDPQQDAFFIVERDGDAVNVRAQTGKIEVRDGDKTLSVAAGESYASGTATLQNNQKNDDDKHKGRAAAIILGVGAAIAAIVFVVTRSSNQSTQFAGGSVGPSPTQ